MNVTEVPSQIAPAGLVAIDTQGNRPEFTFMVIGLEVAGLPVAHVRSEVSVHSMISPLFGVFIKIVLLVPLFNPLTFH